jgi:hypothetical protein
MGVVFALGDGKGTIMRASEIQPFRDKIGIDKLAVGSAREGVRADWSKLPAAMPSYVRGLRLLQGELHSEERGVALLGFDWQKDPEFVSVDVYVSGVGPKPAREKLVSLASQTSMMEIPFAAGPPNLGDIAVEHTSGSSTMIIWAFRNVCIRISNSGSGVPAEPAARAIQAFMKASVVPDISVYLPHASIAVSPKAVHVGNQVQVAVTLAKGTVASDVLGSIDQGTEHLLEEQDVQSFSATYQARQAGHSRINISLVNRKTLLSPDLGVDFAVLP